MVVSFLICKVVVFNFTKSPVRLEIPNCVVIEEPEILNCVLLLSNAQFPSVRGDTSDDEHLVAPSSTAVSYTHLDVYKRQYSSKR